MFSEGKMKKFWFIIWFLFVPLLGNLIAQTSINPLMEKESSEEFKKKREEWLRSLHRCEEGLPYWIVDQKTKENIQHYLGTQKFDAPSSNSYAEGRIFGEWIEKGSDNLAGRVHTVDYDTNTSEIFLASAGGNIWKGTINGNDWICLNNGKKFANPRMVKILSIGDKRRIVVAANSPSAVYFTDDEGNTWQKAKGFENAEKWGWIIRAAVTTSQTIYVLLVEWDYKVWKSIVSLYKSIDYGVNFSLVRSVYLDYSISDLTDIWAPRYDSNILYLVVKDTLYSVDEQNNFNMIRKIPFIEKFITGTQIKGQINGQQTTLYLALKHTNVQTIFYYSNNGGKTFTNMGSLNFYPFEKNSFEVSQTNPSIIYFGQVEFYRSTDNGTTWNKANKWEEYYPDIESKLHADIPGIVSFRKWNQTAQKFYEILFVSTDGGIYVSFDNGLTFRNLSLKNLNISQYYSIYTFDKKGKTLFAGSQDQGFQACYDDNGKVLSFRQLISGDYGHLTSSDGGRHLWSTYPAFAMLMINPQLSTNIVTWNFQGSGFLWLPPIYADPDNPYVAYLISGDANNPSGTPASFIYKLTYDETKNEISHEVLPFNFAIDNVTRKISSLAFSPLNTNIWFALTNDGKFFRSFDRGTNWELIDNVAGPQSHYLYGNKIVCSKYDLGKIVIAGSGYSNPGVLISYDTGKTFVPLGGNLPSTLFYDIELNENESMLFAGTEIGPFVYHFAEKKWYFLGGGNCPDNIFWDVEYLPELSTVRFATYGRGIWDFKIEKILKSETQNTDIQTLNLNVKQNLLSNEYFIEIDCQPNDYITINIFDVEGRNVRTLFEGISIDGKIHLYWDGTTDARAPLASGKYFIVVNRKFETKYFGVTIAR